MNTLSIQRPRPSIEILIPAALSVSVKVALVNCEPWSGLKISGRPNRARASSRASTQKLVSRVFDSRHDGSVRARATALGRRDLVGYRAAPHKEGRTRMRCIECGSQAVTERPERTAQGYRRFRCRTCGKQF